MPLAVAARLYNLRFLLNPDHPDIVTALKLGVIKLDDFKDNYKPSYASKFPGVTDFTVIFECKLLVDN